MKSMMDMLGKGGEVAPEEAGDDLEACCGDMLEAIGKKDPKAMAEAMRACVACCQAEPEEVEKE